MKDIPVWFQDDQLANCFPGKSPLIGTPVLSVLGMKHEANASSFKIGLAVESYQNTACCSQGVDA